MSITPTAKIGRNKACPCGSGRKYKKCCGAKRGQASPSTPGSSGTPSLFEQAQALLQQGRYRDAITLYQAIIDRDPDHAQALHYLGVAYLREGDLERASIVMQQSLTLRPNEAVYHNNFGMLQQYRGDESTAQIHFRRALALDPSRNDARFNLGRSLMRVGREGEAYHQFAELARRSPQDWEVLELWAEAAVKIGEYQAALENFRLILEHKPENREVRVKYAEALAKAGHAHEARAEYARLLDSDPEDKRILFSLASLEEANNRLPDAAHWQEQLQSIAPDFFGTRLLAAKLLRRQGELEQAEACLNKFDLANLGGQEKADYFLELGMILDRLGRYQEAFTAFQQFNNWHLEHQPVKYSRPRIERLFAQKKEYFQKPRMKELTRFRPAPLDSTHPRPIFIVGFPRSGTTLVEQILSAHPSIAAGDELVYMQMLESTCQWRLASEKPYPECLSDLALPDNKDALMRFRDFYYDKIDALKIVSPGQQWFVDKTPLNEIRLGMIHLLFPGAPIIHVIRHPLDVCLSCYFNYLTHGDNCAFDLADTAFHYAQALDLTEHFRQALDLRYMQIRYEDLVKDPEPLIRELLQWIGAPWDERCLTFHESGRTARSASYAQVSEKLYTRSSNRYLNYRNQLTEIISLLEPALTRLGYRV